jgi:hypothetical protein
MFWAISPHRRGRAALFASAVVALLLLVPVATAAQDSTATVKFRAFGAEGSPAPDLKPADLALKVDGKPREIVKLDWIDLRPSTDNAAKPAATEAAKPTSEPPFHTNVVPTKGRDVFIMVDEESIGPGRDAVAKDAANHLLAALTPGDRAALISTRQGGPHVQLTTDHALVRKGLASIAGYGNPSETSMDLTCRTVRTIQAVQSVLGAAGNTSAPAVVLMSTSVATLQAGAVKMIGAGANAAANLNPIGDLCQLRAEEFQRLGAAAQSGNVAFYAVELLDASARALLPDAQGGLENLAGATNGEMMRTGANTEGQMARIAQGLSYYYLATFNAQGSDFSGAKRVELSAARSGITLRAPRELSFARSGGKTTPRDMIRTPARFNDLPLRAAAFVSRNPGDNKIKVLSLFEPAEAGVKLNAAIVGMYNQAGTLTGQWTAQAADLAGPTGMAALAVPDGVYRLRVAATDASGRAGTVDIDNFSATLVEAGPIKLGDLVLGKMGQSGLSPVMQFSTEAEAIVIVELYGRPAGGLRMYVEVIGSPEPIQMPLSPAATNEQDKFLLSAKLPIGALKPGDYTVRAVVAVEGQPEGVLTTTLRKSGGS